MSAQLGFELELSCVDLPKKATQHCTNRDLLSLEEYATTLTLMLEVVDVKIGHDKVAILLDGVLIPLF